MLEICSVNNCSNSGEKKKTEKLAYQLKSLLSMNALSRLHSDKYNKQSLRRPPLAWALIVSL